MQRGGHHHSSPRSHHHASWLTPKCNRPIWVSFRRTGRCPEAHGSTKCHPGWWQCSSQGGESHSSEMSLMVTSSMPQGLHMMKHTTEVLWLLQSKCLLKQVGRNSAPVWWAVAGTQPWSLSSQRPFPHHIQEQILGMTSRFQSTSQSSQCPHLSHLGQSKTATALAVQFPCFQLQARASSLQISLLKHVTSTITLPGEKVVLLWRTHVCPAKAAGTGGGLDWCWLWWVGQHWKQAVPLLSASFWLFLLWEAVCPLGKADEGVIQKSQDGLSAAESEGWWVWKKNQTLPGWRGLIYHTVILPVSVGTSEDKQNSASSCQVNSSHMPWLQSLRSFCLLWTISASALATNAHCKSSGERLTMNMKCLYDIAREILITFGIRTFFPGIFAFPLFFLIIPGSLDGVFASAVPLGTELW